MDSEPMKTDDRKEIYERPWDNYWSDVTTERHGPFWDSLPEQAIERDLREFKDSFDPALPVIDVGCGNGTQTRHLAQHFPRVIGVDVSPEAIRGAPQVNGAPNLQYRTLDILDSAAVRALHDELGDANLYVRVVLHQLRTEHHLAAIENLSVLLGQRGRAYVVELSPAADELFKSLAARLGAPPPKLQKVFTHNIVPATLKEGELLEGFRKCGLEPRKVGTTTVVTTQALPSGEPIEVPCDAWLFFRSAP